MKIFAKLDTFFIGTALVAGIISISVSKFGSFMHKESRYPSSQSSKKIYELHIQNLALSEFSKLQSQEKVFLRATFDKDSVIDIGSAQPWPLNQGDSLEIDYKLDINDAWVKNDQLEFKLELMGEGWFTMALVRCAQVAKEVSSYNRAYTCTIPGEKAPLLTYRLAEKGVPPPNKNQLPVASN
ncbi:hypothetical protein GW915_09820 [bacterium]|nr:hypothetical protein [bacterium]